MFKREGFWRRTDRNPEAVAHTVSEPGNEGFAQHTFESAGDLLEGQDPEMLPLPTEQHPVTGEPRTLLRKRQVKQLLSITDSSLYLAEVAGRRGIEIADQASRRLESSFFVRSSSVLARELHFGTQIDHIQFPCRFSAMAIRFQPF